MDERRLGIFVAVARSLSFSRAAEVLHLSQPAVSQHIATLEAELGCRLFERAPHRVTLTLAGRALLERASALLGDMAEARRAVASAASAIGGNLTVGASRTIGEYVLPGVLARFGPLHPNVCLRALSDNTAGIIRRLMDGELDIAFVEGEVATGGITLRPFRQDELMIVAPSGHPWAEQDQVPLEAFVQEPIVLREPGSGTRQVMETALRRAGVDPASLPVVLEQNGTEGIKAAVEAGLGISVISRTAVRKELRLGTLIARRIEDVPMVRDLSEVVLAGAAVSPAAAALSAFLRSIAEPSAR